MALSVTVHGFAVVAGPQDHGRWATADITTTDGSDILVYTVPLGIDYAIASVLVCNRADTAATPVSIAIAAADIPLDSEWAEWNTTIVPRGTLERTQLLLTPGDRIIIRVGTPA
jgi:hypothetical protein